MLKAEAKTTTKNASATSRKYCNSATSRLSPPWASHRTTMADAAPGDIPQIPDVPGMKRVRAASSPIVAMPAINPRFMPISRGRRGTTIASISGDITAAIRQPNTAWAISVQERGTRAPGTHCATTMPEIIGPSIRAPGRRTACRTAVSAAVRIISAAHDFPATTRSIVMRRPPPPPPFRARFPARPCWSASQSARSRWCTRHPASTRFADRAARPRRPVCP